MLREYFSTGNKKYKKYGRKLVTFGLPAHKSCSGLITCPGAGKCLIGCYAQQGWYRSSRVKKVQEQRLKLTLMGNDFILTIHQEIARRQPKFIRIHDSGDFYCASYLNDWVIIAEMNPHVIFFTYSKMVPMVKAIKAMPKNLFIVLSEGGKWDDQINQKKDLFARVFRNANQLRRAGFVNGGADDLKLILKGHKKIGLVYHGYGNRRFDTNSPCKAKD